VLRACYAAVIVVLGLSAVEAYRIQISVSEQHLDIYRRYAGEEAQLSTLRRNLWLAGNDIRDFFIHCTSIHAQQFDFLQRAIVPKREELYSQLLNLAAAGQTRWRSWIFIARRNWC
jgi:hypothetical protein